MSTNLPHVWIVLVNYNGLADTQRCLRSLQEVAYPRARVVVVDNASSEDPSAVLATEFPRCHVVRHPVNGGWAGGNNVGIRHALARGADQVLLLNNDTVVAPDLVDRLVQAAGSHPDYGIIGPVIRYLDEPDQVMTDGCEFNRTGQPGFFQRRPVPLLPAEVPAITQTDIVNGCCMMVATPVFQRIGLIDERFFLVHEESDFCLRTRRAGYRCGVIGAALVWHKGSSTFQQTGRGLQRYFDARNLWLLLHKHPQPAPGRRGPTRSRWEYLKYVYHRYTLEKEHGREAAADAILEGLHDALAGKYGPRPDVARPAVPLLRRLFEACRQWRINHPRSTEGSTHAHPLRQGSPGLAACGRP